jgi:hypothetical protein
VRLEAHTALPETIGVPLIRLIYVSHVARPTRLADVEEIVSIAAERNAANGITGLLVYTPSHFIQALEGDDAAVRRTFERIRLDPRHVDVRIVGANEVVERRFQDWAMTARPLWGPTSREFEELTLPRALELLESVLR